MRVGERQKQAKKPRTHAIGFRSPPAAEFAVGRADSVDRKERKNSHVYAKKAARKQAKVDAERAAKRARATGGNSEGAAAAERRL